MADTEEPLFFTIGLRRASRVVIAFEPWSEPQDAQLEEILREYAPQAEFSGNRIAARCHVGFEKSELIGGSCDVPTAERLRLLAENGARRMSLIIAHIDHKMNLSVLARILVAGADLTRPIPTTPEEIIVLDAPMDPFESAMGERMGYISQGSTGTRFVLPGFPCDKPLAAWANAILRERAAAAIISVLAERSVDAS